VFCAIPLKVSGVGRGIGVATASATGVDVGRGVAGRGVITIGVGVTAGSCGVAVARGVAVSAAAGVALGRGEAVARASRAGRGSGRTRGRCRRRRRGRCRRAVGCATSVAMATGPRVACATGVSGGNPRTGVARVDAVVCVPCAASPKENAPIPRPATTTPIPSAIVGNQLEDDEDGRRAAPGCDDDEADRTSLARFRTYRERPRHCGKSASVCSGCRPDRCLRGLQHRLDRICLATPLRVGDLLTAAVLEALGPRAPQDKRERVVRSTLDGFGSGTFVVEIDGRVYDDADEVAVCSGTAILRFFLRRALAA